MERLPATLLLMLMTTVLAVAISLPLASWVATRGRGTVDGFVRIVMAVTQGTPVILVGTFLIIVLALKLGLFPVSGYGDTWPEHLYALVLPSLTMALYITPMLVNSLRSSLREALSSEYVGFAKAKGLAASTVLSRYAIRNGSIAGLSILGVQAGGLVGSALVVENVFAVPGMGTMMMTGILNRDFAAVQAATLVFGCLVVLIYLVNDLLYAVIDPRVALK
jgi:peptide/nickel transport system permease protein